VGETFDSIVVLCGSCLILILLLASFVAESDEG
jgi:hypothetical protein